MEEPGDLARLIGLLRRVGQDTALIEVKAAAGGLPRSVRETLSAFSNGEGGTLVLGLSERDGFTPAPGFDAARISDALAGMCADDVEPPIRAEIQQLEFEGAPLVVVEIPAADPLDRPVFVKNQGQYQGSYIRGGDGDRKLTHYEVSQLLSSRGQPRHDAEAVLEATVDDLDGEAVDALLARVRRSSPRAFAGVDRQTALLQLGVLTPAGADLRPTLAGLLTLSRYPQRYFPQLFVSFVALPGVRMGQTNPGDVRFDDNLTADGPVPEVVANVLAGVRRNMRSATVVTGGGRQDRFDYPLEVVRELVVNALMHRDYSPHSRGTQVQVELYPDRLVVRSPGGLFGSVVPTQLGVEAVSSTRNATLAKLLSEVPGDDGYPVCENRASGLTRVMALLRDAGMSPPEFDIAPGHVHVTVPRHALLDPTTLEWIGRLGASGLATPHHLALAMARNRGRVTNEMLRSWGVDAHVATAALRDLVQRGLLDKLGGRRYATYELATPAASAPRTLFPIAPESPAPPQPSGSRRDRMDADRDAVVAAVAAGHTTVAAVAESVGLSYITTNRRVHDLLAAGRLVRLDRSGRRLQLALPPRSER